MLYCIEHILQGFSEWWKWDTPTLGKEVGNNIRFKNVKTSFNEYLINCVDLIIVWNIMTDDTITQIMILIWEDE